jgi:urease accessory protein
VRGGISGGVSVRVEGTTVVRLKSVPPLAAKILPGPTLMIVGSAAGLLAGDGVRIQVDLAPGAQLTVHTTAATIAHPCPSGGATTLAVDCRLGAGARLAWLTQPLIACAGCHHHGRAQVVLGPGASATWLDTVTLGRTGEQPGFLEQRLDVELDGRVLLREGLRVGAAVAGWNGPAVLGRNRHVATLHLLGRRVATELPAAMQLAGLGTTARFVAQSAHQLGRQVDAALPWFL